MATNFDITALSGYVQENKFDLIGRTVLNTKLAENMTLKPGLQGEKVRITLMSDDFNAQEASCGWGATGSTLLTKVDMDLYHAEVERAYCPDSLRDTWLAEKLKSGAQFGNEQLPEEQVFAEYFVKNLQKWNEGFLIKGAGSINGIQAQLVAAEGGSYAPVLGDDYKWVAGESATASGNINALEGAMAMFAAMPFEIALADDQVLVVNPSDYKALVAAMVNANLFHYTGDVSEVIIPGTKIKVIPTSGIAQETDGKNFRFLTTTSNMILGTDLVSDYDVFDVWYSKDNREVRAAMKWTIGVAVVEPNLCVTENAN